MKKGFLKHIDLLLRQSNLILEIVDCRFAQEMRNKRLETRALEKNKKIILVMNKSDLLEKEELEKEKKKMKNKFKGKVVFVSAKKRKGINLLKKEINQVSGKKEEIVAGMIGYPNSGKSTLVNALSGNKGRVKTSIKAGYTRGIQKIALKKGVYLIDAPGIIPYKEKDEYKLFLFGAKNPNQLKDIETIALRIIDHIGLEKLNKKFNLNAENEDEFIEQFGKKNNMLSGGGKTDLPRASTKFLELFQKNLI